MGKTRQEPFKFWDSTCIILEVWRQIQQLHFTVFEMHYIHILNMRLFKLCVSFKYAAGKHIIISDEIWQHSISHHTNSSTHRRESRKTMSMEDASTGVLEKIKNIQDVKIKPKKMIWWITTYVIAYVKIEKRWRYTIQDVKPTAQTGV